MRYTLALAALSSAVLVSAKMNFVADCPKTDILKAFSSGGEFECSKTVNRSVVLLNKCIRNNQGALEAGKDGGFMQSCHDCTVNKDAVLSCTCSRGPKQGEDPAKTYENKDVTYNLNDYLSMDQGIMRCDANPGDTQVHTAAPTTPEPTH